MTAKGSAFCCHFGGVVASVIFFIWSPFWIWSTTSIPLIVPPKIVYCPSRFGCGSRTDVELAAAGRAQRIALIAGASGRKRAAQVFLMGVDLGGNRVLFPS